MDELSAIFILFYNGRTRAIKKIKWSPVELNRNGGNESDF